MLLVASRPYGSGFLVNNHKIDTRRDYSLASTRHAGIDDVTEGELEHDVANSETSLGRLHEVDAKQIGLGRPRV
jgi:hypothetical protein